MKKMIIGACLGAALTFATTSCGCGNKCEVNNDTVVSAQLSDSISTILGQYAGMDLAMRLTHYAEQGADIDREEFMKGFQFATSRDYDVNFNEGVNMGISLEMTIQQLKEQGVNIDRHEVLDQVRKYIMRSDIVMPDLNSVQAEFEKLINELSAVKARRDAMIRADQTATPEVADTILVGDLVEEVAVEEVVDTVISAE